MYISGKAVTANFLSHAKIHHRRLHIVSLFYFFEHTYQKIDVLLRLLKNLKTNNPNILAVRGM